MDQTPSGAMLARFRLLAAYWLVAALATFTYMVFRESFVNVLVWAILPFALAWTAHDCVKARKCEVPSSTVALLMFAAGDVAAFIHRKYAMDAAATAYRERAALHFALAYLILSEIEYFRRDGPRERFLSQRTMQLMNEFTVWGLCAGFILHCLSSFLYFGLAWVTRWIATSSPQLIPVVGGTDTLFRSIPGSYGDYIQWWLLRPLRILACLITDACVDEIQAWWVNRRVEKVNTSFDARE